MWLTGLPVRDAFATLIILLWRDWLAQKCAAEENEVGAKLTLIPSGLNCVDLF